MTLIYHIFLSCQITVLESSKPNVKKNQQSPSVKYQTSNDPSQLSVSSAWPSTRNLWSNFNDDFFSKGFDGTSFGNWRSDIEERSNRVLNGYNPDPPKVETSSEGNLIYLKLRPMKYKKVTIRYH